MTAPGHSRGLAEFIRGLAGADQRTGQNDVRQQFRAFQELGRPACLFAAFFDQFPRTVATGIEVFGLAVSEEDEVHGLGI